MKKKLLEVFIYMTNAYLTLKDPQPEKNLTGMPVKVQKQTGINFMKPGEIAESRYLGDKLVSEKRNSKMPRIPLLQHIILIIPQQSIIIFMAVPSGR